MKVVIYEGLNNPCNENAFKNVGNDVVYVIGSYSNDKFCGLTISKLSGKCGDNCFWKYDINSLEIIGSGLMNDYIDSNTPWYDKRNNIKTITIE